MKTRLLYPNPSVPSRAGGLALPVELCRKLDLDSACSRCDLHSHARNPCIPADGEPGGVLLVGERPGNDEDVARRPMIGLTGKYLRDCVKRHWSGPVVYDNAVRCFCGEVEEKAIEMCRPFLAQTIQEARPTKIIALGAIAWRAITGRKGNPLTQRRAYAWLGGVPVYQVIHNAAAKRNRFVAEWFEADLEWVLKNDPPFPRPDCLSYHEVETAADAAEATSMLSTVDWVAIDAETSGRQYTDAFRVISMAVTTPSGETTYVWGPEQLDDPATAAPLRVLLINSKVGKVGSNLKSDLAFLRHICPVRNVRGDVRLWRKLDNPEASGYLEDMAELVGMGGHKEEMRVAVDEAMKFRMRRDLRQVELFAAKAAAAYEPPDLDERLARGDTVGAYSYGLVERDLLLRYNVRDSVATALLGTLLEPRLDQRDGALRRVWGRIVQPMSEALSKMEAWGVPVSLASIDVFDAHLKSGISVLRSQLDAYGKDFNPGSAKQVAELLFKKLGLTPPEGTLTRGGAQSVSEEVLEYLSKEHELPKLILDYRSLAKMKGTYCDGMREHVRPDGRIHPSILPDGARSGRTSCIDPNLQNIPRADDSREGKMARDIFVASPGHLLLHVDYKQLEYRVAALLSQDPAMIDLIVRGLDFHTGTAELISPIMGWAKVEKPQRSIAKTLNFALLFRMAIRTLAGRLGVSEAEAEKVWNAVLGKFRRFAQWSDKVIREAKFSGYCRTWWDGQPARWRSLWHIADEDEDGEARSRAEHGAVNSPVQGTAADFCNASIPAVIQWIEDDCFPAELVLAIHDALLLNVREDCVDEAAYHVSRIMTQWPSAGVPIEVEVEVGSSWGGLKEYKLAA